MKLYTFVTTYVVKAPDESKAREVVEKLDAQLCPDDSVVEHLTKLTDIEDEEIN